MPIAREKVSFETVTEQQAGQRIDNFLISRLKGLPRTRLYRILRKGEVRVNKGRVSANYRLAEGDVVRIPPLRLSAPTELPVASDWLVKSLTEAVCYEDEQFIVLNKPSGLAVHGGSGQSLGLIEALRQVRNEERYLELVHRLDKETSGCLIIAKKRAALQHLHKALREKTIRKYYQALVIGHWPAGLDSIQVPLRKNILRSGERMVVAAADGKPSKTLFRVLKTFENYTLVEAMPVTGRTHQIRVHSRVAGYPICGDSKYGVDEVNKVFRSAGCKRMFLHASAIEIPLPEGFIKVECPPSEEWVNVIAGLK